ncbi:UNKNOWN [Stylonychia lemnae]|uniref:Uncharacterized protein n=1 Tax=Stylonychia lemnae TaxID=5949 RepID=A0A078ANU3_STYLE|nr:UNKNOWN [Stylonychia lemnae]|eukprot:CDW83829.1 UNKNOWN [Stylonychia lemnae]
MQLNKFEIIKEAADEQQSKTEVKIEQNEKQPLQIHTQNAEKENDLNDAVIDLDKQEIVLDNVYNNLQHQCLICEKFMTESDVKISKKLESYFQERGEIDKVMNRIRGKMNSKVKDMVNQREIDIAQESLANIACFRCMYDMILSNEGRSEAMKIFQVAHMQIQNEQHFYSAKILPRTFGPNKQRIAHDTSIEMKQIGLFKGTFYDYNKQAKDKSYENISPALAQNLSNAVIRDRYQKNHQSMLISLPRENSAQPNISNTLDQQSNDSSFSIQKTRPWRVDFNDKIEKKFGSLANFDRQQKILKKIEKDRLKYMLGNKMHNENIEILKNYRSQQRMLRLKSNLKKFKEKHINEQKLNFNKSCILYI